MSIFSRLFGDGAPAEEAPLPYDPASPEGLAARWVRWVAGVDYDNSPVADRTGAQAGRDQPEDVWFLAGSFGSVVERRCVVPAYRPLFFPAFNMWHVGAAGPPPHLPHAFGEVIVDGQAVAPDVIATPVPFEVAGVRANPVTGTHKPVPVTVWGLWTRLEPLEAGHHVIGFHGGDGHGFTVTTTYLLDVSA